MSHRQNAWTITFALALVAIAATVAADPTSSPAGPATSPAPSCPPDMVPTPLGSCLDRFEWPNRRGALPLRGVSALPEAADIGRGERWDAAAICATRGKRVCTRAEWEGACKGSPAPAVKPYRAITSETAQANRDAREWARMDQRDPSGSLEVVSDVGAEDMIGGLEEWVSCAEGPDGFCLMGGHWSGPRSCSNAIAGHHGRWHYWSTGLRCCSDGWPVTPAPDALLDGMITAAKGEVPWIKPSSVYWQGIAELAPIYADAAKVHGGALLGSADLDAFMLAANGYFESRNRPRSAAGDNGASRGAQQVSTGAVVWLPRFHLRWAGVRVSQLAEPRTNASAALEILKHWRHVCRVRGPGSGDVDIPARPGVWFTAYRRGSCPPRINPHRRRVGSGGVRRCALLSALLARAGSLPPDWACGHERRALSKATSHLVAVVRGAPPIASQSTRSRLRSPTRRSTGEGVSGRPSGGIAAPMP